MKKNTNKTIMFYLFNTSFLKENLTAHVSFLLICDAPDFRQLRLQDPASSSNYKLQTTNFYAISASAEILNTIGAFSPAGGVFVVCCVSIYMVITRSNAAPLAEIHTLQDLRDTIQNDPNVFFGNNTIGHWQALLDRLIEWRAPLLTENDIPADLLLSDFTFPVDVALNIERFSRHQFTTIINLIYRNHHARGQQIKEFLVAIQNEGGPGAHAMYQGSNTAGMGLTPFEEALCSHIAEAGVGFRGEADVVLVLKEFLCN